MNADTGACLESEDVERKGRNIDIRMVAEGACLKVLSTGANFGGNDPKAKHYHSARKRRTHF